MSNYYKFNIKIYYFFCLDGYWTFEWSWGSSELYFYVIIGVAHAICLGVKPTTNIFGSIRIALKLALWLHILPTEDKQVPINGIVSKIQF